MKIELKRIYKCAKYTIGHLFIDGEYFCDTIEDCDRGLDDSMSLEQIKAKKIYAETAIPTGIYTVSIGIVSPKFSQKPFYKEFCDGRVPRLLNVKGFDGILMHIGLNERSSAGCIIVGENKIKGQVINSQATFERFYEKLKEVTDTIMIEIK
ncbi:MAG: DUF5675 family protein [Prevotella sp.]|jgi:hypothetical protein|nr:DUF5675 family protein [Prevotella sp.]